MDANYSLMTYKILWLCLLLAVPSWLFATEVEPNDINPQNIDFEESIVGELSSTLDVDRFALDAAAAGTITLSFSSALNSSNGWEVQLVDSSSNILSATICDYSACQEGISIPVGISAAGTYTIVIRSE